MSLPLNKVPNLGAAPSTSEIISKYLREAITSGDLVEDEPIRQDEIAKLFNVSKIPVREALKRLEAEGLVLFQRNRGAVVTKISEPELAQIFEIRVLLECQAIRLSIPNMDKAQLAKAEAICAQFEGEEDVGRWSDLNWAFHACLYEPAQRPVLIDMIRSLHDKIERYLRVQMSIEEGKARANEEHRQILQVCKQGDIEAAENIIGQHIEGVCQALYQHLPSNAGHRHS